jgi:predicted flap endonuclease-1-like 5' DNA nuclease
VERKLAVSQLSSELTEVQARCNEAQRLATERQTTMVSVNAQLSEYRARIAEADISTAEMQATLLSLGSQLESHRVRLAEIERRAQAPKEALAPSAVRPPAFASDHQSDHVSLASSASPAYGATPEMKSPAPPPQPSRALSLDSGRIVSLQCEIDNLFHQLQNLREAMTARPLNGGRPRFNDPAEHTVPAEGAGYPGRPPVVEHIDMEYMVPAPYSAPAQVLPPQARPPAPVPHTNGKQPVGKQPVRKQSLPESEESLSLEMVKGIGSGYATRLRAAGVQSIRDLANTTPGQLEAIINAPKWRQPDYASWIRAARMFVRGL